MNMNGTGAGNCAETVPIVRRRSPQHNEAKATRVYVVEREGVDVCKIGVSSFPKRRLSTLRVSSPDKLSLFFQCRPGSGRARDFEARALKLLSPWRAKGEWLNCSPRLAKLTLEALMASDDRIEPFLAAYGANRLANQKWEQAVDRRVNTSRGNGYRERRDANEALENDAWEELKQADSVMRKGWPDLTKAARELWSDI